MTVLDHDAALTVLREENERLRAELSRLRAAPGEAPRPPDDRFDCIACGVAVKADEDGCCVTCGHDCVVFRNGVPTYPPVDLDAESACGRASGEIRMLASTIAEAPDVDVPSLVMRLGDIADDIEGAVSRPAPGEAVDLGALLDDLVDASQEWCPEHDPKCNAKHRAREMDARAALVAAFRSLSERAREAETWQREVAEGLGYLNRAEGQSGHEVADPGVIIAAFRGAQAALVARHGGEPVALLAELDEARDRERALRGPLEFGVGLARGVADDIRERGWRGLARDLDEWADRARRALADTAPTKEE